MEHQEIYAILEEAYFGERPDEAAEMHRLPKLIVGVDLFVDVGASLGPYTCTANACLENATLVAIEADPIRVRRLRELCQEWAEQGTNRIEVVPAAAGQANGRSSFIVTDSNISGSLAPISDRTDDSRTIEVDMRAIDSIVEEYGAEARKIFVKMDIEGGEYAALAGSQRLMASGRQVIFFVEMHAWGDITRGKYPADCFALMRDAGFYFLKAGNHYVFSRTIPQGERANYGFAIAYWRVKAFLRRFPALRALNRLLKGDPRRRAAAVTT